MTIARSAFPEGSAFHAVAYGPSGSGKTNALLHLILADIEDGRPVAVLDPKKQLIDDITSRIPDTVSATSSSWTPRTSGRSASTLSMWLVATRTWWSTAFWPSSRLSSPDGWGPRSADIFSAALRTLARASTPKRPATLVDLPRLLTDPRFRRQQVGRVQGDMALGGFWSWYEAQSPQAQATAIAPPLNKLRQFLLRPALIRMLDQRSGLFRLRDMFRENKIVLVPLNEGLIGPGTASLLGSLAIADLWQATQERADKPDAASGKAWCTSTRHPGSSTCRCRWPTRSP